MSCESLYCEEAEFDPLGSRLAQGLLGLCPGMKAHYALVGDHGDVHSMYESRNAAYVQRTILIGVQAGNEGREHFEISYFEDGEEYTRNGETYIHGNEPSSAYA